jgi:hypothetical protein
VRHQKAGDGTLAADDKILVYFETECVRRVLSLRLGASRMCDAVAAVRSLTGDRYRLTRSARLGKRASSGHADLQPSRTAAERAQPPGCSGSYVTRGSA